MRNTNLRPLIMFGLMMGLMLVVGLGIVFPVFLRGGELGPSMTNMNWWSGMWGMGPIMLGIPCVGFGFMILMMFFFSGMGRRGRPMGWMRDTRPETTKPATTGLENTGPQSPVINTEEHCAYCGSLMEPGWKVCPHCGASKRELPFVGP